MTTNMQSTKLLDYNIYSYEKDYSHKYIASYISD